MLLYLTAVLLCVPGPVAADCMPTRPRPRSEVSQLCSLTQVLPTKLLAYSGVCDGCRATGTDCLLLLANEQGVLPASNMVGVCAATKALYQASKVPMQMVGPWT